MERAAYTCSIQTGMASQDPTQTAERYQELQSLIRSSEEYTLEELTLNNPGPTSQDMCS